MPRAYDKFIDLSRPGGLNSTEVIGEGSKKSGDDIADLGVFVVLGELLAEERMERMFGSLVPESLLASGSSELFIASPVRSSLCVTI